MGNKLLLATLALMWFVLTVVKFIIGFVSIAGFWPAGFLFIPIVVFELILSWSMYAVSNTLTDQGAIYSLLSVILLLNLVTVIFLTIFMIFVVGLGAILAVFTLL